MLASTPLAVAAASAPPAKPGVPAAGAKTAASTRASTPDATRQAWWIELAPKDQPKGGVRPADTVLTERALARRALRRTLPGLVDASDLPIAPARVSAIRATGATVRTESRWLNAVSVLANDAELRAIMRLPFVASVRPLRASQRVEAPEAPLPGLEGGVAAIDYGYATQQLSMIGIPSMHTRGYRGEGMVIGILDTGFHRVHEAFHSTEHPLQVIAEHDFVKNDGNTDIQSGDDGWQHAHGTWILGTLAAYKPGGVVGSAFNASFVLAKTEDVTSETSVEEDYYVAGLEFIEAHGADLATSSLGYIDWYTPEMLDGNTAITTRGVNAATANGLVCITAAGNEGHDANPTTLHIIAPADAPNVITCGAANSDGSIAGFSSDGPSADGRVKPEVLARGVATATVASTNPTGVSALSGTSLSTPIVAGVAALVLEARGEFGVTEMRNALCTTASDFVSTGTTDPLFARGYGIVSAIRAAGSGRSAADLNLDGSVDAADLTILLGSWGPCVEPELSLGACAGDINASGATDAEDLAALLAAWGA
jgi:subtilisin family serine protease